MPVFISHRTADNDKARTLAYRLKTSHNILSYVDDFDPETATTKSITELLVSRIKLCTHLMALITDKTGGSWWVPFEIGVARQADRRITSFDNSYATKLPEYLTEWPVLKNDADLDKFAEAYHRDTTAKPLFEKFGMASRSISTPEQFHSHLKAAIRGY